MAYRIKDRVKFLSQASKILSSSLDYRVTLASITRLVVANIADFCMIDLLKKDGKLYRVASHVADKKKQKAAQQMFNYPADPKNKRAIYETARKGKPILIRNVKQKWLNKASRISEERRVLKKLGVRSFIFTPLKSRNRVIGVLTLVSSAKNFSYSNADMVLAQELASRAGVAVDNARLFSDTQEALGLRDLFIAMAAHELRTPITTIHGYTQMLHSKFAGTNTAESRWIEDLSWETLRLTYLVNELLEVNRIKSGQFDYIWKECSLMEIIRRALSDFRFIHPRHKIIFQNNVVNGKDVIIGDFNKLVQLVINLLDNAAKFSSPKTEVTVGLKSKAQYLALTVKDQGKGIKKADLPKVFEKFYQGTTYTKEGLGVGLFLVKNIIRRHRGTISIFSEENMGTTLEVKLPMVKRKLIP